MLSKSKFLVTHSIKDITRRRCYYLICLFASFLIGLVALISKIVVDQGPIIFLMLAEQKTGQIDISIKPITMAKLSRNSNPEDYRNLYTFINYTALVNKITNETDLKQFSNQSTGRLNLAASVYKCEECRRFNADLVIINTNQEKKIELGRNYTFPPMKTDECIIEKELLDKLNFIESTNSDKKVFIKTSIGTLLKEALFQTYYDNKSHPYNENITKIDLVNDDMKIYCRVVNSFDENSGKFEESDRYKIIMEQETFLYHISNNLRSNIINMFQDFPEVLRNLNASDYSNQIIINFESPRVNSYLTSNFYELQMKGVSILNKIVENVGEIEHYQVDLPVINKMQPYVYGIIFLGLILKIILLILFVLSLILMHSLLIITTETNSFELGILRMLGTTKLSVVIIIVIQCLCISLPGFIMAYLIHFPCLDLISSILSNFTENGTQLKSEFSSVIYSLIICNLSPLVSSIHPIRTVLAKNISKAINTSLNKTSAIKIEILSMAEQEKKIFVIFGLLTFVNGACIYYFLPLSLISMNVTIISGIFLWILIGMLCGFIILSMNFENLFQKIFTHIFLFWSNKITKILILKNLTSHRLRNRCTTLMYSISVGFFIMITVGLNIELSSMKLSTLLDKGAYILISSAGNSFIEPSKINPSMMLMKNLNLIEDYSFYSPSLAYSCSGAKNKIFNFGKSMDFSVDVFAIPPNFFNVAIMEFLKINEKTEIESKTSRNNFPALAELLYAKENDGRVGLSGIFTWEIDLHLNDEFFLTAQKEDKIMLFNLKSSFILHSAPTFQMSDIPSMMYQRSTLIPANMYIDIVNKCRNYFSSTNDFVQYSLDDFPIRQILLKLKSNSNILETAQKIADILYKDPDVTVSMWYYSKFENKIDKISNICNLIFNGVNIVVILICFFNSSATMSINILEQKKEIAIIRSIGMTNNKIFFVYLFETFILIFTASFMGLLVGTLISWTMTLQRVIFTNLPLTFSFPYYQLVSFVVLSIVGSFISTVVPVKSILNKKISSLIRGE